MGQPPGQIILSKFIKGEKLSLTFEVQWVTLNRRDAVGMQMTLRKLERARISEKQKLEIIWSVQAEKHEYLSFFVCRNPIEKLLSVYHYLMDLRVRVSLSFFI